MKRLIILLNFVVLSVVFGQGKHTTIVIADGYAHYEPDKSESQIRDEALLQAKRTALEKVKTRIRSISRVDQNTLTYDVIETDTEGSLRILETQDFGFNQRNQYHVRIRVEVEHTIPFEMDTTASLSINKIPLLTVRVWTDQKKYHLGQKMQVYFQGNKPYYALVVYRTVKDEWIQILPNPKRLSNHFASGEVVPLPNQEDPFDLIANPPIGTEEVIVLASTKQLTPDHVEKNASGYFIIDKDIQEYLDSTKRMLPEKDSFEEGMEMFQASCIIEVVE